MSFQNMNLIRKKAYAATVHALITVVTASISAFIVFQLWFPGALASLLGGVDLFLILLCVEVCLGPLISLIIYNPSKSKRELLMDYSVVALFQLAAILYGLYTVALSRPVFIVFVKDRVEIVAAVELTSTDLKSAAYKDARSLPLFGPKIVCTQSPVDPNEKSDLLMSALSGKDIQLIPKYYRVCDFNEVVSKAQHSSILFNSTSIVPADLPKEFRHAEFRWLPVATRFGYGLILYPTSFSTNDDGIFVNLDPFARSFK